MWTKSWTAPCTAILALTLQGCLASNPPSEAKARLDASLTEPCPQLPLLTETDGKGALRWMIGAAESYNDCALKHHRLVEAVR